MAKSVYFLKWEDGEAIYFIPFCSNVQDGCFHELHIYREFTVRTCPVQKYSHTCHKWFVLITPREFDDLKAGRNYSHFLKLVTETIATVKPHFIYTY